VCSANHEPSIRRTQRPPQRSFVKATHLCMLWRMGDPRQLAAAARRIATSDGAYTIGGCPSTSALAEDTLAS